MRRQLEEQRHVLADFRNIMVWQRAHELVLRIYAETQDLPTTERYGLQSQLRRAAVSIPTNIAEGSGRRTPRDFAHFLAISAGSASEVHYLLMLACDLGFLAKPLADQLIDEVQQIRKMVLAYREKLT